MAPVSSLPDKSNNLQSRSHAVETAHSTSLQAARSATHVKLVSELSDSGMAPFSTLPAKFKVLWSRS